MSYDFFFNWNTNQRLYLISRDEIFKDLCIKAPVAQYWISVYDF